MPDSCASWVSARTAEDADGPGAPAMAGAPGSAEGSPYARSGRGWASTGTRSVERLVNGGRAGSPRARTRLASARSRSFASSERRAAANEARSETNDELDRPAHRANLILEYITITPLMLRLAYCI